MNTFTERLGKLSKRDQYIVRKDMEKKAFSVLASRLGMTCTNAQLRAAAKQKIQAAIAQARKAA